ncbi:MAG: 50S ribosomal protein L18 [Candidatus Omnitrophica bacterium]|nr:50S ribosomal protein L18 [Candidatus Omnitrophota bacterium]
MKKIKDPRVLRRLRIKKGLKKKILGTPQRPRLSVFRSNTSIYAQIIDDVQGKTLVGFSSRNKALINEKLPKTEISRLVGKKLAEKALQAGINEVVFDRNGYSYHGRVKALADGAREGGLKF